MKNYQNQITNDLALFTRSVFFFITIIVLTIAVLFKVFADSYDTFIYTFPLCCSVWCWLGFLRLTDTTIVTFRGAMAALSLALGVVSFICLEIILIF